MLLAVYRDCDYISLMSLLMFRRGWQSDNIDQRCLEVSINFISDKQNYGLLNSNLQRLSFILVVLGFDMLVCLSFCALHVLYCVCLCHYIIFYLWNGLIGDEHQI